VKTDIAIIGGGLGGLYLASLLEQRGLDYQLLEAKPKLGGRILSEPINQGSLLNVDLGPTWFWPHQTIMQRLLKDLHVEIYQQYTEGDALYQMDQHASPHRTAGAGGLTSYRVVGGMSKLIDALVARTNPNKIKVSHVVTEIEKDTDAWAISIKNKKEVIKAEHLIIATPPRIATGLKGFSQIIPASLVIELDSTSTWMAVQAKFVAVYDSPFWRDEGLAGEVFSRVGPLAEIHDACVNNGETCVNNGEASADNDKGYALFGFVGLPVKVRKNISEGALKQLCLKQLAGLFGEKAFKVQKTYLKDWANDSLVSTQQDIDSIPEHPHLNLLPYQQSLAEIGLSFAGTEYAVSEAGYLEGALVSAEQTLTFFE
jgi:monoamine oxidase